MAGELAGFPDNRPNIETLRGTHHHLFVRNSTPRRLGDKVNEAKEGEAGKSRITRILILWREIRPFGAYAYRKSLKC